MGYKDATLRLRLDPGLMARLDALERRIQYTYQHRILLRLGEVPGMLTRSKVSRAALLIGVEALEAEVADAWRRYEEAMKQRR